MFPNAVESIRTTAIALKPDGIVLGTIDAASQRSAISAAIDQGIKVIGWHSAGTPGPQPDLNLITNIESDPVQTGAVSGAYTVVMANGQAGVVVFTDSAYAIAIVKHDAMMAAVNSIDGSTVLELVDTPIAPAEIDTTRVALTRSPTTIDYFANAAWSDRAPAMVQSLLIESFEQTGKIISVSRDLAVLRADYILMSELRRFEARYENGEAPPTVFVRLFVQLIKMPERTIIGGELAEAREPARKFHQARLVIDRDQRAFDCSSIHRRNSHTTSVRMAPERRSSTRPRSSHASPAVPLLQHEVAAPNACQRDSLWYKSGPSS